jgi:hypothetical protein
MSFYLNINAEECERSPRSPRSPVSPKIKWWEFVNANKNKGKNIPPIIKQGFKINLK